jgi:GntR family transcriptional regulator, transcriptional repressor for pyruvate dehydrogenase complex
MSNMSLPSMEPAHKTSVRLARELANYISDNRIPEGTRLPAEVEMARTFGVGRTTLREALRLLELRGVINIRVGRGGGPVVREPHTTDLAEGLALVLQFQRATLGDVVDARLMLEPAAARQAASKATAEMLQDLRATVDAMLSEPDPRTLSRENSRFHSLIASTLGNPVVSVYIDCLKHVHDGRPSGIEYAPKHIQAVARAHLAIIQALESGDPDASEAAMRKHLEDTKAYWTRKYGDLYHRPLRWSDGE